MASPSQYASEEHADGDGGDGEATAATTMMASATVSDGEHEAGGEEAVEEAEAEEEADKEDEEEEVVDERKTAEESDEEEFAGFGEEWLKPTEGSSGKRQQAIVSDDDDDEDQAGHVESGGDSDDKENGDEKELINRKKRNKRERAKKRRGNEDAGDHDDDDNENDDNDDEEEAVEEEANEAIGESDENTSHENGEQAKSKSKKQHKQKKSETKDDADNDDDDDGERKESRPKKEMTDLETVLNRQRAEHKKARRKRNVDSEELNEMDNKITAIISEMKHVAAEDRASNEKSLTALGKLKMLPLVVNMLQKSDYHATMIELGVLGAISEWLAPLPDRSLPNIKIREELIDALKDFGEINSDYLKSSGVGKAVMFLYKNSNETKTNKHKLEKLINNWSRPIFNLDSNFKQLTKEERLRRDIEHVKTQKRRSSDENKQDRGDDMDEMLNSTDSSKKHRSKDGDGGGDESKKLRPGDPGFCPRARVPLPSSKDYIHRPKSNVESMESSDKKVKKPETMLSKHKKRFIEIKKFSKANRAVTMSINK